MTHLTLTPAYNRDYRSAKAVEVDLLQDKDFTMQPQGCYVNLAQLEPGQTINVRYQRLTKVAVFDVAKLKSKPVPLITTPTKLGFADWIEDVGKAVSALSGGLTISDFADAPTADWHAAGKSPAAAAKAIVKNDW